jgi:tetratricopeptide (TPR) repeat protein
MQHLGGSLILAERAAERAFELNPGSHSIQHTQAEIARRMANETDDPLRRRAFRRITREKLGGEISRASEYDLYTRARLAIDEFKELSAALEGSEDKAPPAAFIEAAKEAETAIQRGLQIFPDSSELLSAEATFRECLDQTARAQRALERAFALNPRQDWLAVRVARKYQAAGDLQNSKRVLDTCLHENPSSKVVHLEMGRVLIASGDSTQAIEHLRRSFTEGDSHYEAQFWYARELFIQGHFADATKFFSALNERAPGRFRTRAAAIVERDGLPVAYNCHVERKEEGYAFLKLAAFPNDVFASRADSNPADWEKLNTGANAVCALAFSRRGPRAISIRPVT